MVQRGVKMLGKVVGDHNRAPAKGAHLNNDCRCCAESKKVIESVHARRLDLLDCTRCGNADLRFG